LPTKTALLLIATGARYHEYAKKMIASANEFFVPHDVIIFTDDEVDFTAYPNTIQIEYSYQGYPEASYRRYHAFTAAAEIIRLYDYAFYVDTDMRWTTKVTEDEIFSNGITATEHPGYVGTNGTPETNPLSAAYCPIVRNYFCGGFNGGTSEAFLKMSRTISEAIDRDDKNEIQATWVDESFLNHYLFYNPPAKILSPAFCYPENAGPHYKEIWRRANRTFEPKLVALEKGGR
jgi:hypothetical protein